MNKKSIILISCGHFEKDITDAISKDISKEFNHPVFFKECSLDISDYYNPGRRQYDANMILSEVNKRAPEEFIKVMGLMRVDLYIPILTYIFGQAALNGKTGIASLYRLRNELYGLPADHELLKNRFRKVVIHEMGHTFGLIHCINPVCVMRSSTYVEDLDQKEIHLCNTCKDELLGDQ